MSNPHMPPSVQTSVPTVSARFQIAFSTLKFGVSFIAICLAVMYLWGDGDVSSGVKASLFAIFSAAVLILGGIPTGEHLGARIIDITNRFVGMILGMLAGWNWFVSEANGDVWPHLTFLLVVGVPALVGLTISILYGFVNPPKIQRRVGPSPEIQDELQKEYRRLWDTLETQSGKHHESWTFMVMSEQVTGYVLSLLRASRGVGLSDQHLADLLRYADEPAADSEMENALRSHYRRLRMIVRSYAGETTPDPVP